jgi:hypothetical protein
MSKHWLNEAIASVEPAALAGDGHAAAVLGVLRAQLHGTEAINDSAHLARIRAVTDADELTHIVSTIARETWPDDDAARVAMERRLRRKLKKQA